MCACGKKIKEKKVKNLKRKKLKKLKREREWKIKEPKWKKCAFFEDKKIKKKGVFFSEKSFEKNK